MGILPDIPVKPFPVADTSGETRPQRVRERDLQGHFTHGEAEPESEGLPVAGGAAAAATDGDADVQLDRAIEVLKSRAYFERLEMPPLLESAQADAAQVQ